MYKKSFINDYIYSITKIKSELFDLDSGIRTNGRKKYDFFFEGQINCLLKNYKGFINDNPNKAHTINSNIYKHDDIFKKYIKSYNSMEDIYKISIYDNPIEHFRKNNQIIYLNNLVLSIIFDIDNYSFFNDYFNYTTQPNDYKNGKYTYLNLEVIKRHIDFKKNHQLENGYIWINEEILEEVKKRYTKEDANKEKFILYSKAFIYLGDDWKLFVDEILNLKIKSTNPINLTNYINTKKIYKIPTQYDEYIYESLKPEIPQWLKSTKLEEIILDIIEERFNEENKRKFMLLKLVK